MQNDLEYVANSNFVLNSDKKSFVHYYIEAIQLTLVNLDPHRKPVWMSLQVFSEQTLGYEELHAIMIMCGKIIAVTIIIIFVVICLFKSKSLKFRIICIYIECSI